MSQCQKRKLSIRIPWFKRVSKQRNKETKYSSRQKEEGLCKRKEEEEEEGLMETDGDFIREGEHSSTSTSLLTFIILWKPFYKLLFPIVIHRVQGTSLQDNGWKDGKAFQEYPFHSTPPHFWIVVLSRRNALSESQMLMEQQKRLVLRNSCKSPSNKRSESIIFL